MKDRYIYPAIIERGDVKGFCVTFPDLPGCITEGDTIEEAFMMAKEALELHLFGIEEDNDPIPVPSTPDELSLPHNAILALVEAWMPLIRSKMANQSVKKNCTVPKWLASVADQAHVNYSQVLQDGLMQRLGITGPTQSTSQD